MSEIIKDPTWYADIRFFFNDTDKQHMRSHGLELGTYDSVKANAAGIYTQVAGKQMPPDDPWDDNKIQSFLNWIVNGYPMGTPAPLKAVATRDAVPATRIRKELRELSDGEIEKLTKAFNGILDKADTDPNSYFIQAGYHWYPGPDLYCQHHVNNYNPWHRAYLHSFENALRSVPGCEDVTIPYWDFENLSEFPALLTKAPFDSYTLPEDVGPGFDKGYVTQRYSVSDILKEFGSEVSPMVDYAMTQKTWELFNGFNRANGYYGIIGAHDNGHVYTGPTMRNQGVAAFDPIFWFFHANWDRLWWKWQQDMDATTLETFISTITDQANLNFFTIPAIEVLPPFTEKTVDVIDLVNDLDTDYQHPAVRAEREQFTEATGTPMKASRSFRSVDAQSKFTVDSQNVSVRVKGIDRFNIAGSFTVHLTKDGKTIARRGFFQPDEAKNCATCGENQLINLDFRLPLESVQGGELGVHIEPADKSKTGDRLSLKNVGTPTINVRLLLGDE